MIFQNCESRCATSHLYEQRIKELFLEAAGILMEKREAVIGDCRAGMEACLFENSDALPYSGYLPLSIPEKGPFWK